MILVRITPSSVLSTFRMFMADDFSNINLFFFFIKLAIGMRVRRLPLPAGEECGPVETMRDTYRKRKL